jgi:hypothetical protein
MLFLDDEGTEMGGLMYGGFKDKDGKIQADGHLSFDQYMQDQIFALDAGRSGDHRWSAMYFADRGDFPISEFFDQVEKNRSLSIVERAVAWKKFSETHPGDHARLTLGRTPDNSSEVRLKDPEGRDRIVLKVDAGGQPTIQLLDDKGTVVSQLPPKQ